MQSCGWQSPRLLPLYHLVVQSDAWPRQLLCIWRLDEPSFYSPVNPKSKVSQGVLYEARADYCFLLPELPTERPSTFLSLSLSISMPLSVRTLMARLSWKKLGSLLSEERMLVSQCRQVDVA
jgi:hypothetical protein